MKRQSGSTRCPILTDLGKRPVRRVGRACRQPGGILRKRRKGFAKNRDFITLYRPLNYVTPLGPILFWGSLRLLEAMGRIVHQTAGELIARRGEKIGQSIFMGLVEAGIINY